MAGPTTAGRPCQPTNPPPKRYTPPNMTKSKQYGNLQRQYIDPKIIDSRCGASTQSYVATYGHNSTCTTKPTTTLSTNGPHHTLPKNQEKYATETVFKSFTTSTTKFTKESTSPHAANPLSDNRKQETPKPPTKTNSPTATHAKDHTPPNIENKPQSPGNPINEPRPYCPPLHKHQRSIVDTTLPIRLQNQSPRTLSNHPIHPPQKRHPQPTLSKFVSPCTLTNSENKLTESAPLDKRTPTNTLTTHPIKTSPIPATRNPLPLPPPYPQHQIHNVTPHPNQMITTPPILQVEIAIFPS